MTIPFFLILLALASSVTGDHHHQLNKPLNVSWDLLESLADGISSRININVVPLRDMAAHSLWLRYAESSRSYRPTSVRIMNEKLTGRQYVKSRIQMVGSILLGPEKSWSLLYSVAPREPYSVDAKLQCILSSMTLFAKHCGFRGQYQHKHMKRFENLCAHVSDRTKIEGAIIVSCGSKKDNTHVVNLSNPRLEVTPTPLDGSAEYCERIAVMGVSRENIGSFAKALQVSLKPTRESSYGWYKRAKVCFHANTSLGPCECEKNDWISFEDDGGWTHVMSPYKRGILDVKFNSMIGDSVSISIEEVLQPWRYLLLGVGFALFLEAQAVEMYVSMVIKSDYIDWMIRVIAILCIFESSKDTRFALAFVMSCLTIFCITKTIKEILTYMEKFWPWSGEETLVWSCQDTGFPRREVHVATTPHPSKKPHESAGSSKSNQKSPASDGAHCESCNRYFRKDIGLQAHNRVKHAK